MKRAALIAVLIASCLFFVTTQATLKPGANKPMADLSELTRLTLQLVEQIEDNSPNAKLTLLINGERFVVAARHAPDSSSSGIKSNWFLSLGKRTRDYALNLKLFAGLHAIRLVEQMRLLIDRQLILVADLLSMQAFGLEPLRRCAQQ